MLVIFFFFNDTPTTEIYTLSLHALFRSLVTKTSTGCSDSISSSITIYHVPQAAFQADTVCHGNASRFTNQSQSDSLDRKSTRLNSSHGYISYAVFCLKKKKTNTHPSNIQ